MGRRRAELAKKVKLEVPLRAGKLLKLCETTSDNLRVWLEEIADKKKKKKKKKR